MRPFFALALALLVAGCQAGQVAGPGPRVWYVQAEASGDGLSQASPFGSLPQLEQASGPGDLILVLPADAPLDGGLALKPRQILRGFGADSGARPVLTNTSDRNGGNGLTLADGVRVEAVEIRDTQASGLYGEDVEEVEVTDVVVVNANVGGVELGVYLDDIPYYHGGITLLGEIAGRTASLQASRTQVLDATATGVAAVARNGARVTLRFLDGEVRDGAPAAGETENWGVLGLADGDASSVDLEIAGSAVSGRMGRGGRNVIVGAGEGGVLSARIQASVVGAAGQDGVIASMGVLPARIDLTIADSTIENAAQSNVEGTILARPPHDEAAARASLMDVAIYRSTIRGAGSTPGFEGTTYNVNMTGSFSPRDEPLNPGEYRLRLIDSVVEASRVYGLRIGTAPGQPTLDPGHFDVLVRGTRFEDNGTSDVLVGARDVDVDARGNCWVAPDGREGARVMGVDGLATDGLVDVSSRVPCAP